MIGDMKKIRLHIQVSVTDKSNKVTFYKTDGTYFANQIVGVLKIPITEPAGPQSQLLTCAGPVSVFQSHDEVLEMIESAFQ